MPRHPGPDLASLAARLEALEERVARLERGKLPPGDGRNPVPRRGPSVTRCPGCGLPLQRRGGRCAHCGVPL
jgi:predicted amidophosphoribosyltransferase